MKNIKKMPYGKIIVVLSILLIFGIAGFFSIIKSIMINDSIDQTLRMIQIISEEKNSGLSVIFKDWYEEVSDMSTIVLDKNDNFDTETINQLEEHFDHLTIYDLDGNVMTNNINEPGLINDYISHLNSKQYFIISKDHVFDKKGPPEFDITVTLPIINSKNITVGGIALSYRAGDLSKLVNDHDRLTNTIIINNHNEVILYSDYNALSSMLKKGSSNIVELNKEALNSMNSFEKKDSLKFIKPSEDGDYILYVKNPVSDWILIVTVDSDVLLSYTSMVTSQLRIILVGALTFTGIMYTIILLFYFVITRILHDKSEFLKLKNRELKDISSRDSMTGLYNKNTALSKIERILKESEDDKKHALLFVDIDDFKKVNDLYGHDEGDRLIISFAELLKSYFREDDIIGRFGGDEFIVFVKNIKNTQTLKEIVERFCIKINERNIENSEYDFTTSIGISIFPEHGEDTVDLIKNADIALYESKDKGKNTYNIFKG